MDVVRWGGAVVTSLGFISLATLVMLRGAHRAASAMFFGLTGVGVLGNTVFEICATGSYGTPKDDMVQYGIRGLLLLICAIGMTLGGRAQNSP